MFGMVNNAIRSFILDAHGTDAWAKICASSGIDEQEFASLVPYDDALSLQIIAQASATTGRSVEELLHEMGRYWVRFATRSSFGPLIAFGGAHFEEFLGNLDAMHSKIKASLPALAPPSFQVRTLGDNTVEVRYRSCREGLFPFVEGLFEGLSEHFGQSVDILAFEQLAPGEARWTLRLGEQGMRLPAA